MRLKVCLILIVLVILVANTTPGIEGTLVEEKNLGFNSFDEEALLSTLNKNQKKKALDILRHIKEQGDQLTFDGTGIVFIEGKSLPGSNIYQLLHSLFSAKPKSTGFAAFVAKLQQMGLSRFLPKKCLPVLKVENTNTSPPYNLEDWYYLGP